MRIEPYSDKWRDDVLSLVESFCDEAVSEYTGLVDKHRVIQSIEQAEPEDAFLMIIDEKCQGIIYGMTFLSMTSQAQVFQEVMWYVNKPFRKYGIQLLKEAEKILKLKGVSIMIMAVLENSKTEKLKRFYEHMGFKKMEEHWVRTI